MPRTNVNEQATDRRMLTGKQGVEDTHSRLHREGRRFEPVTAHHITQGVAGHSAAPSSLQGQKMGQK
jgi:hypothetical protein